jgi:hypothetical protein
MFFFFYGSFLISNIATNYSLKSDPNWKGLEHMSDENNVEGFFFCFNYYVVYLELIKLFYHTLTYFRRLHELCRFGEMVYKFYYLF